MVSGIQPDHETALSRLSRTRPGEPTDLLVPKSTGLQRTSIVQPSPLRGCSQEPSGALTRTVIVSTVSLEAHVGHPEPL